MNPHFRNPAGRLWALLVHCQLWGSSEDAIQAVVAKHLDLAPGYSAELLDRLAAILRLPGQVRGRITAGAVPAAGVPRLLDAVAEAESALATLSRLDAPVSELRDRYGPETLSTLKEASVWLNSPPPDRERARGTSLKDVTDLAQRLMDDTRVEPSLDSRVLDVVSEHGSAVVAATGRVVVAGPEAVAGELHRLLGHLAVRPDVVAAVEHSEVLSDRIRELVAGLRSFGTGSQASDLAPDWRGLPALTGLLSAHPGSSERT